MENIMQQSPDNPNSSSISKEELRDSAFTKFLSGDLNGAFSDIEKSLKTEANYALALIDKGIYKAHSGELEEALKNFVKVLELEPNNHSAAANISIVKFNQQNYDEALEWANAAIEMKSDIPYFYSLRGHIKIKLSMFESADSDLKYSLQTDPNNVDTLLTMAQLKEEIGDETEAKSLYSKVIDLDPDNYTAFYNRGRIEVDTYNKLIDFQQAIKYNPNFAKAYTNTSLAWFHIEEFEKGLDAANKAVDLNPKSYKAYSARGWLKVKLNDNEGAIQDFEKTIQLGDPEWDSFFEYLKRVERF